MGLIPLFVAIPLGAAFLISLLGKRNKILADGLSNLANLALVCLSLYFIPIINANKLMVYRVGGHILPIGIAMAVDGLAVFMLVIVSVISLLVNLYSVNYLEKFTAKWKFYTLFMLMIAGMNGVIISGDMFNLYVFLEIAAIASYALVAFGTEHEELEASFKYMVMGGVASGFILLGIAILYSYTSTLNMADMARALELLPAGKIIPFVSVLFIMGFGLKAALAPFHAWLPDAHPSAPAPISAMLSGLLIKVLGIYALVRIFFNVLGMSITISNLLIAVGAISMVIGAYLAIGQQDMKRLLAYSSISQIGYVAIGFALATPLGILGALFHLANHAVFKSLLFLNSGAVEYSAETRDFDRMGGLNSKMPVTGATSLLGSMSISGVPPLSGFWSKLIIILACVQAQRYILAAVAILVSILTLAYYLRLQKKAFFGMVQEGLNKVKEVPPLMKFSMIVLAALCVIGGLLLLPKIQNAFLAGAANALLIGKDYAKLVFMVR